MNHSNFEVVPFENRNGSSSWRVVGWLNGDRVRKNFKTRAEAFAEKVTLEVRAAQTEQGMRTVATTLTAAEVREAETVFHRLRGRPCPLSFYVDFALSNYNEPEHRKKLVDACTDYVAAKQREFDQHPAFSVADAAYQLGDEAAGQAIRTIGADVSGCRRRSQPRCAILRYKIRLTPISLY